MIDLHCLIVTPERTVLDREVDFVALPLYDGEIGIAPGRAPMVGRLGPGEIRITSEKGFERLYVEGGFVEVVGTLVTVLTSRAVYAGEIDEATVREELEAAKSRTAAAPEDLAARDRLVEQARGQLLVARRNKEQ